MTPQSQGYSMPAEWAPHEATWLSWPNNKDTWTEEIEAVEAAFAREIECLAEGEIVKILVDSDQEQERVRSILNQKQVRWGNVRFIVHPTVDVWIRDYGPNFVVRGSGGKKEIGYNKWIFNAWGNKYADLATDTKIFDDIASRLPGKRFEPGIVLEGGSIEVNGAGVCLTTEQCLLNQNRNPKLNRGAIERKLKEHLGVVKVLWLAEGVEGDDTDGHIDDIARFTDANTIVAVYEEDESDANHKILHDNWERLESMTDAKDEPFRLIKLPMPDPVIYEGNRLPASYANFLIANKHVLVPIFGSRHDQAALKILKPLFPNREVVGIDCRVMVRGFGTLHCASQQQPALT
ncbi:MAG: agmatine deiminase family protein [Candidatus Omnitrophica bacterium]|nr:agmatine deiminase family protein [Candidatus Omnitrophota bacterium]